MSISQSTVYGKVPTPKTLLRVSDTKRSERIGVSMIFDENNFLSKASRNRLLSSQIQQIVFTRPGERVMLPRFGIDINGFLFDQVTPDVLDQLRAELSDQIDSYVPQAKLIDMSASISENELGAETLTITLLVRDKEQEDNLEITLVK